VQGHLHLISPTTRRLVCVCASCSSWYGQQNDRSLVPVPRVARELLSFRLTNAQWQGLCLPADLAFCYWSSLDAGAVAVSPTRDGVIETRLPEGPWGDIVAGNRPLQEMAADVEGLLVHRVPTSACRLPLYVIMPIDVCYQLVGILRAYWRGDGGGDEVWTEVDGFLSRLRGQ